MSREPDAVERSVLHLWGANLRIGTIARQTLLEPADVERILSSFADPGERLDRMYAREIAQTASAAAVDVAPATLLAADTAPGPVFVEPVDVPGPLPTLVDVDDELVVPDPQEPLLIGAWLTGYCEPCGFFGLPSEHPHSTRQVSIVASELVT